MAATKPKTAQDILDARAKLEATADELHAALVKARNAYRQHHAVIEKFDAEHGPIIRAYRAVEAAEAKAARTREALAQAEGG